jgi:hypothetical protein
MLISSVAMAVILWAVHETLTRNVFLSLTIGILSYLVFIVILKVVDVKERKLVGMIFGRPIPFAQ